MGTGMADALFSLLWTQRAEAGDPVAQFNLGYCHEMGQGTAVDLQAAFGWYLRAAQQGHARAQYHAGLAFSYGGKGVSWDLTKACKWLILASRNGVQEASEHLRRSSLPAENRLLGERAANLFRPTLEARQPCATLAQFSSLPPIEESRATQLGLGL